MTRWKLSKREAKRLRKRQIARERKRRKRAGVAGSVDFVWRLVDQDGRMSPVAQARAGALRDARY